MEYRRIEELIDYIQPNEYIVNSENYDASFLTPVLTPGKTFILGYTNEGNGIYNASKDSPIILFDDFTTEYKWVDFAFKVKSSACKILKPKKGVNLRYVFYAMKFVNIDKKLHKRYWISIFSKQSIYYPNEDIQNSIVTILDKIVDQKNNFYKTISKYNDIVKSQFIEMFDGKYKSIKIGNEFKTTSGGTPLKSKKEYYENGTIPWLTSGEVNSGLIYNAKNCITELGMNNSSAKLIPPDSVLVAMYGATAGVVGLLKKELTTNQAVCSILPNKNFYPEYLYYSLMNKSDELRSRATGGAQPNISQAIIRDTEIYNAPINVQLEFVNFVQQIDKSKFIVQKQIKLLEELFEKKMNEYFGD